MKVKIVDTHIEWDEINNLPVLVYTDETGVEYVQEKVVNTHLIRKDKSFYFRKEIGR